MRDWWDTEERRGSVGLASDLERALVDVTGNTQTRVRADGGQIEIRLTLRSAQDLYEFLEAATELYRNIK